MLCRIARAINRDVTVCEAGVRMGDPVPHTSRSLILSLACFWARGRGLQNVLLQSWEWVSYQGKVTFFRNYQGKCHQQL